MPAFTMQSSSYFGLRPLFFGGGGGRAPPFLFLPFDLDGELAPLWVSLALDSETTLKLSSPATELTSLTSRLTSLTSVPSLLPSLTSQVSLVASLAKLAVSPSLQGVAKPLLVTELEWRTLNLNTKDSLYIFVHKMYF